MPRRPDMPCSKCGELMWRTTTSLPPGQATCLPCRRAAPPRKPDKTNACIRCGEPAAKMFCSRRCACIAKNEKRFPKAAPSPGKVRRYERQSSSGGLTTTQQGNLLRQWRKQGRTCSYCDRPAQSVDHVVPLFRGGTSKEGNLAPACRGCNGSKGILLVIEWRTGKRLKVTAEARIKWAPKAKAKRIPVQTVIMLTACQWCSTMYVGSRSYCSGSCHAKAYRARHPQPRIERKPRACSGCGGPVPSPRRFKCDKCVREVRRLARRRQKAAARARVRLSA